MANKSLIFFSVSPTNLSNNSGPFTTLNSETLSAFAKVLAIKVLPVPGGPYNKIPFTCLIPRRSIYDEGYNLLVNALLNILDISASNPPIPISLKLNPNLVKALAFTSFEFILNLLFSETKSIAVSIERNPKLTIFLLLRSSLNGPKGSISNSQASIVNPRSL